MLATSRLNLELQQQQTACCLSSYQAFGSMPSLRLFPLLEDLSPFYPLFPYLLLILKNSTRSLALVSSEPHTAWMMFSLPLPLQYSVHVSNISQAGGGKFLPPCCVILPWLASSRGADGWISLVWVGNRACCLKLLPLPSVWDQCSLTSSCLTFFKTQASGGCGSWTMFVTLTVLVSLTHNVLVSLLDSHIKPLSSVGFISDDGDPLLSTCLTLLGISPMSDLEKGKRSVSC